MSETAQPDVFTARDDDSTMEFGSYYYSHDCGIPYERNEYWLEFFEKIAKRIVVDLEPSSVLDVGCAFGMLVEALRAQGVDAYGMDISQYAIDQAAPSVRDYLWQGSLADPLTDAHYDLVTCIEVIEHIPPSDTETAIDHLCAVTDRVLLSSSPLDYREPTHVNVKQPDDWSALLARRGFHRDLDSDPSFLTPWAALYVREERSVPELVRSYERHLWQRSCEVRELRESVLDLQRRLEEEFPALRARDEVFEQEILETRDELIGAQSELGEALGRIRVLESELMRYELGAAELEKFTRSPVWRWYEPYDRLRRRLGTRARAFMSRLR